MTCRVVMARRLTQMVVFMLACFQWDCLTVKDNLSGQMEVRMKEIGRIMKLKAKESRNSKMDAFKLVVTLRITQSMVEGLRNGQEL